MNLEDIQIGQTYRINDTFPDARYHGTTVTVVELDPPYRRFPVICDHVVEKRVPHAAGELDAIDDE